MARSTKSKNPIDADKVADQPHLLPYAHHLGSAIIRPVDKGRIKGLAMQAMYEQTETQLQQIVEQIELLVRQAQDIHDRISISEKIYLADIGFQPIVGHTYYLYERTNEKRLLSLISPTEWGAHPPFVYLATVRLLADSTWEVMETSDAEAAIEID